MILSYKGGCCEGKMSWQVECRGIANIVADNWYSAKTYFGILWLCVDVEAADKTGTGAIGGRVKNGYSTTS